MRKYIQINILICLLIVAAGCGKHEEAAQEAVDILPPVVQTGSSSTTSTNPQIVEPNMKVADDFIALVPNSVDPVHQSDDSPLLQYLPNGQLSPVFLKGTFSAKDLPSILKITKLLNQKYYVVFSKTIDYRGSTCRLVEITPYASIRCIDSSTYPVGHVDDAHYLPKETEKFRGFVFNDLKGNIYYASPQGQTDKLFYGDKQYDTYQLMKKSPSGELTVFSDKKISRRLVKSSEDKFYTMCGLRSLYCEISSEQATVYAEQTIYWRNPFSDFFAIAENTIITINPYDSRYNWEIILLGLNPRDFFRGLDTIDFDTTISGLKFYSYEGFTKGNDVYALSDVIEYVDKRPTGKIQSYISKIVPTFKTKSLFMKSDAKHTWTASDFLSKDKMIVSGEFTGKNITGALYETYMLNLENMTSSPILELSQMFIQSARALNEKEVLMIGRRTDDPIEKTMLFKFNVETQDMTILREGAMLDGTTLYVPN